MSKFLKGLFSSGGSRQDDKFTPDFVHDYAELMKQRHQLIRGRPSEYHGEEYHRNNPEREIAEVLQKMYQAEQDELDRKHKPYFVNLDGDGDEVEYAQGIPTEEELFASSNLDQRLSTRHLGLIYEGTSTVFELNVSSIMRRFCMAVTDWPPFDWIVLATIAANCVVMSIDNPSVEHSQSTIDFLAELDFLFLLIFTLEFSIKTIAMGFISNGPHSYLKDGWNWIDFIVVLFGWLGYVPSVPSAGVSALRAFRLLRPLRTLSKLRGMKVLVNAIFRSIPQLTDVFILTAFTLTLFAIVGMQLFGGKLRFQCGTLNVTSGDVIFPDDGGTICGGLYNCEAGEICADAGYSPNAGTSGFDNFLMSIVTIIKATSLEGWCDITYDLWKSTNYAATIYMILMVVLITFFLLQLVTGVIYTAFLQTQEDDAADLAEMDEDRIIKDQTQPDEALEAAQKGEYFLEDTIDIKPGADGDIDASAVLAKRQLSDASRLEEPEAEFSMERCLNCALMCPAISAPCERVASANWFTFFITGAIVLNTVFLASVHHGQPDEWTDMLKIFNYVFTAIFLVEVIVKTLAYGWYKYLEDPFNAFDFVVVVLSIVEIILVDVQGSESAGISAFRSFRLLRVFKLAQSWVTLRHIIDTVGRALPKLSYFAVLLILYHFIMSLLGVQLFSGKLGGRLNFNTLPWGMLVVFQIMGGENWNDDMEDGVDNVGPAAAIYFIFAFVVGNYVLLNLFLAILLAHFEDDEEEEEEGEEAEAEALEPSAADVEMSAINGAKNGTDRARSSTTTSLQIPEKPKLHTASTGVSLYMFPTDHPLREKLVALVNSEPFEYFIIACILLSTLLLAFDEPGTESDILKYSEYFFTAIFTMEMVFKIVAFGFLLTPTGYIKDSWNRLDFVIVAVSWIDIALGGGTGFIKSLRALRSLRPLRMVRRYESLLVVVNAIFTAFPAIMNVFLVSMLFFSVFSILGVNLLAGKLQRCEVYDPESGELLGVALKNITECTFEGNATAYDFLGKLTPGIPGADLEAGEGVMYWRNPENGNFDNFLWSMLTLFEVSTQEMWPDLMFYSVDATPAGEIPYVQYNRNIAFFFVAFLFVGNMFINNLFVGVVVDSFTNEMNNLKGHSLMTEKQKLWLEVERLSLYASADIPPPPPASPWRQKFYNLVQHDFFEVFILTIIMCNVFTMCLDYYTADKSTPYFDGLEFVNMIFTVIFILEAVLKLIGLGLMYFSISWNVFDFLIVVGGIIGFIVEQQDGGSTFDPTVFRVFRMARMLRLVQKAESLKHMIKTLRLSVPALLNVGALLCLLFFVYAVAGMALFGEMDTNGNGFLDDNANFTTIGYSLFCLFRMATGESWNGIMHDTMNQEVQPLVKCDPEVSKCGSAAAIPYYVSFVFLGQFMMLNLFIAVVLDEFSNVGVPEEERENPLDLKDLNLYADAWASTCPQKSFFEWLFTGNDEWMEWTEFQKVLGKLHGGLRIRMQPGKTKLQTYDMLPIPLHDTPSLKAKALVRKEGELYVHYLEGLLALSQVAFENKETDKLREHLELGSSGDMPVDVKANLAAEFQSIDQQVLQLQTVRTALGHKYGNLVRLEQEEKETKDPRTITEVLAASSVQNVWRGIIVRRKLRQHRARLLKGEAIPKPVKGDSLAESLDQVPAEKFLATVKVDSVLPYQRTSKKEEKKEQ